MGRKYCHGRDKEEKLVQLLRMDLEWNFYDEPETCRTAHGFGMKFPCPPPGQAQRLILYVQENEKMMYFEVQDLKTSPLKGNSDMLECTSVLDRETWFFDIFVPESSCGFSESDVW